MQAAALGRRRALLLPMSMPRGQTRSCQASSGLERRTDAGLTAVNQLGVGDPREHAAERSQEARAVAPLARPAGGMLAREPHRPWLLLPLYSRKWRGSDILAWFAGGDGWKYHLSVWRSARIMSMHPRFEGDCRPRPRIERGQFTAVLCAGFKSGRSGSPIRKYRTHADGGGEKA
eukprot:361250-Chlamydomonas_euryale.AAC.16